MSGRQPSILGISFDGLGISGIVNEFLHVANVLRFDKFRVLFDLGYDITIDRTRDLDDAFLPPWVEAVRCIGNTHPHGYNSQVIQEACATVLSGVPISSTNVYEEVLQQLTVLIVTTFERQNIRFLVIENGTLPDNPLFTEAVFRAIVEYGAQHRLRKYVMWRDHDLMWSAEPHLYGSYPYPGVRKPSANDYIEYFVSTEWMRTRMRAWAPDTTFHVLPNRFLLEVQSTPKRSLREAYDIPKDAYLIARCTRVVPQKTIERDLRLVSELQSRLRAAGSSREVFLLVSGPTREDPNEYGRLRTLESELSVAKQVIWADGLLSFNPFMVDPINSKDRFSIRDLLYESDLSSFLTSYDYEGFGNPPGEAMAVRVPFISTTYELYHEVYGRKGAVAPLLAIDRNSVPSDRLPDDFVTWVLRLLSDTAYREQVVNRNLEVCQRFFSLDALQRQVHEVFGSID